MRNQPAMVNLKALYDQDYYAWLKVNLERIKGQDFEQIDWVNLIEELEEMGRREKKAIFSNLKILLIHLLKYKYQSEKRSNSWLFTIEEHRQRIQEDLENSPSLRGYLLENYAKCYEKARKLAALETGIDIKDFPDISPFTVEEILDDEQLTS
ncbi:DUF29 domain-containing protein [Spirulina sp. CS-785/01]|uniref:DUF29 domain-containing protein n=1 Tax=Spirulina sp. CS-785/01 TaxID=3021716 RepID=UPI00232D7F80|nr:DUF29 domain-containing protein [Spirulina sp. CS-785/01]MDB9315869.1 DUF29 domain-containing protein [Spirulina sp. CS-785/01]